MATLQRPSRLRAMPLEFEGGNALEALQVRSNVQPLFHHHQQEAIRRLVASSGTQFDSEVVQAFIPIAEQEADQVFAAAGTSTTAVL